MQLRFGFCELCKILTPHSGTKLTSVAGIHQSQVVLGRADAVVIEKFSSRISSEREGDESEKRKKGFRITCKRPEFNQLLGQTYGRLDTIPLTTKGWFHRKSRGDYFIIHAYQNNPAIIQSPEDYKSFSDVGINENLVSILEKQGITAPTVVQADGIPPILKGRNTLLTAQTGCGKTLAYLLPVLQQMKMFQQLITDRPLNSPLAVVVSPNRELANQTGEVAMSFCRELGLNTLVVTGGHTKRKILNPEYADVDLVVASFGALSKLTTTGVYKMNHVTQLVLDEADTLLDDSFNEKVCHFLKRFYFADKGGIYSPNTPHFTQLILVSATMPHSLHDILGESLDSDALFRVTTSHLHRLMPHVPQKFFRLGMSQRPAHLLESVKHNVAKRHPTIIFSNKAATCDWISLFLNENGVKCLNLNGKMLYDIRAGKLNDFQSGAVDVISCTDIGSRGIDTTRVKYVINYDFPLYMADYIHRCGRTGRVGSALGCQVHNYIATDREVEVVQKIELAARKMEELPNVNGNITRTIRNRILKNMDRESDV